MQWNAILEGPKETPFEGGSFALSMEFPADYPIRPPTVKFVTPVYHPNVTKDGGICLNLLKEDWKPLITVPALLSSIRLLLQTPNMEEALNMEVVEEYRKDPKSWEATAREWTTKYAKPE